MDTSNLLISDWIQVWGYRTKTYFNVKVLNIDKHTISFIHEDGTTGTRSSEDYKPIKITKEILLKNNFINTYINDIECFILYIDDTQKNKIIIPKNLSSITLYDKNKGWLHLNNIQYIHELQHIIKLFNLNISIIL